MGFYKKSNVDKVSNLYYERFLYTEFMKDLNQNNIINFYFGEKYLFGRIDHYSTPIVLRDLNSMKSLNNPADTSSKVRVVNFVADAFNDFSKDFQRCLIKGQISPSDKYLSEIKVYKAYQNPYLLYKKYIKDFINSIDKSIKSDNILFKDFDRFANIFIDILTRGEGVSRYPFTTSAYIKSRLCPMNVSGLVIEIADESFSDDDNKVEQFVKSPNFQFYLQACNNHGFMVDMNAPWRMVADIGTPVMRARAAEYSLTKPNNPVGFLISSFYVNEYSNCYDKFKRHLYQIYNLTKPTAIPITNYCENGVRKTTLSYPVSYGTYENFLLKVPEEQLLEMYFMVRFYEEESHFSDVEKKHLMRELIKYYRANRLSTTLFIFERILNKTFDYVGSITYIIKNSEQHEEEASQAGIIGGGY